jgi:hypothetical protein
MPPFAVAPGVDVTGERVMPAHYVYREPNKKTLNQGDILRKSDELLDHLAQYHPYYASHVDYKYFMVITQGCDLVRRDGVTCASPYITLAAVRPVEEVLRREASKHQNSWQRNAGVIGYKTRDKLIMFVESLLDNNKDEYFYLQADPEVQIDQNCCAFLQLAVTLKSEHYGMCLDAKICELDETFQAKLGHLIGHMYSRVGTKEWNEHYKDQTVTAAAKTIIDNSFVAFEDKQIDEGVAELRRDGKLKGMRPDDIKNYIDTVKVKSRKDKFHERALIVLTQEQKPIDGMRGRFTGPLKLDEGLKVEIAEILAGAGVREEERPDITVTITHKFLDKVKEYFSDATMIDKKEMFDKMLIRLLQDPTLVSIMQ